MCKTAELKWSDLSRNERNDQLKTDKQQNL